MASALITDFYELTMAQGYFLEKHNPQVVFDMFYRTNPFSGGYIIFTGLEELLTELENFSFSESDINYLKSLDFFDPSFIDYLSTYRFHGDIYAFDEGTPAFPNEPLIRVHTDLIDAQIIESFLLNRINFQSLIATKASRMVNATKGNGAIMEFGLRRAQGENGALSASRASFIGGTKSTSNTMAGKVYGIPVSGTMAHSWIMSFDSEEEAFREYCRIYPDNAVLLIDTYDTLGSGIDSAIKVGLEMKKKGKKIGVRIDSGDLSYLPKVIRRRLDEAGLENATICISNDLTEEIVSQLVAEAVPIDSWGIGTHLVTGGSQASLNGVYKLAAKEENGVFMPKLKVSNSYEKTTNPGIKQVYRFYDQYNMAVADLITLADEVVPDGENIHFYHPFSTQDHFVLKKKNYSYKKALLAKKMEKGRRLYKEPDIHELQDRSIALLSSFDKSYRRQINPHIYKVSLSAKLREMKTDLIKETKERQEEN